MEDSRKSLWKFGGLEFPHKTKGKSVIGADALMREETVTPDEALNHHSVKTRNTRNISL